MKKLMYLTENIDELDIAEHELEDNGIPRSHIHVLSRDVAALEKHDLPALSDWSARDITLYGLIGAAVGFILAISVFVLASIFGVSQSSTWLLVGIGAVMLMGFCTWEGGLIGVSKMNHRFDAFQAALKQGSHLLIIDIDEEEKPLVQEAIGSHPALKAVA